jgi:hypothetical protein
MRVGKIDRNIRKPLSRYGPCKTTNNPGLRREDIKPLLRIALVKVGLVGISNQTKSKRGELTYEIQAK